MKILLLTATAVLLAAAAPPSVPSGLSAQRISDHVKVLASDAFEGRQPGTPGEARTVRYLIEQFRAAGLEPGGEGGGWTQAVPITLQRVSGPTAVSLRVDGKAEPLVRGADVTVQARSRQLTVSLKNAELVFAGYGVHRPNRGWDDYAGVDVRGKVVVVLPGAPAAGPPSSDFDNYMSPRLKQLEAVRLGAVGLLVVSPSATEDWETTARQALWPQIEIRPEPGAAPVAPNLVGSIRHAALAGAMARAGYDLPALVSAAAKPGFRAQPLARIALRARYRTARQTIVSRTVIGRLTGRTRPDEVVVYSAHWDHLGRGAPTGYIGRAVLAPQGPDDIYNGAVDNAAGVASMIEIARAFAKGPRPARSLVFISFTEEEPGLLGSEYYVHHPVYPLTKTVADLNMDTVPLRLAPEAAVIGGGKTDLEDAFGRAVAARGLVLLPTRNDGNYYKRSDHYQFAKAGIPALMVSGGGGAGDEDDSQPSTPWALGYSRAYMPDHYHHVSDAWRPEMDWRGARREATLLYDVGRDLADGAAWPQWRPGAGFRRPDGTAK